MTSTLSTAADTVLPHPGLTPDADTARRDTRQRRDR